MSALRGRQAGDPAGTAGPPIDLNHLEAQAPHLRMTADHAGYYLAHGLERRLDPTPFFVTDWYAWQNPDWPTRHGAPYLHYLDVGQAEGRDPSPFVDVTRYLEATGGAVPPERVYRAILGGLRSPATGVYETPEDLDRAQRAFIRNLAVFAHRIVPPALRRRSLVVCQAGPGALFQGWGEARERSWDLMVNYYDARGFRPGLGEYVLFQKGTKFTAMRLLMERFGEILASYDHVLFLDDDIATTAADLDSLFAACRGHGLDLAQMALTECSACNWGHLFRQPAGAGPRRVSAVEIMMPVLSRRALGWIAPTLGQSVSGFGLDLVWGKIVTERGGSIAVLDDITATHARPVNQSGGAFYRYLRRHGINAKAELWSLVKAHDTARDMITL